MCAAIGEEGAERLFEADNSQHPITAQVNTLKTSPEKAILKLMEDQAQAAGHEWMGDCLTLHDTGSVDRLSAYEDGDIYIQDTAARLAVMAAGPEPGMFVIDGCAAPGGKSFSAAIHMQNKGEILSCDIHKNKLKLIESGAARLGIDIIETAEMDAGEKNPGLTSRADIVIADVPCSGTGVIRKKPDIRYKDPETLAGLPAVQLKILKNLSGYVKPGGIMLYCTCTLRKCENEEVIGAFLSQAPEFTPEGFTLPQPIGQVPGGMITLWPHIHGTDGFFICRLKKKSG
jgi:16S rRNA (cytosine967-C5)-methyltransferase